MTMWIIILWSVMAYWAAAMLYLGFRLPNLFSFAFIENLSKAQQTLFGLVIVVGLMGITTLFIDFINAIVCVVYLAMIWAVSDFLFWVMEKFFHITFAHYYAGWTALILSVMALTYGWYLNHNVWKTDYQLTTSKDMNDLRIVMFADAHIGTTFNGKDFAKHISAMQAENPDIVLIIGDYVDDETTKENMIEATKNLGKLKTKYGTYFVFGNHDKGYYGPEHRGFTAGDLIKELTDNGITVLRDESVLIDNSFYIIGRRDYSEEKEHKGKRQSIKELTKDLNKSKYMIVLDHQPTEYDKESEAKVDLVLSGHTHGGQLFPFNQVGKWIKANERIYGYEKRQETDFIVTSGISSWAIKFKTGTKSEFVIINLKKKH